MRLPRWAPAAVAVLILAQAVSLGPALARDVACKEDPEVVGPCFTFRGKLFIANGSPSARILRLGTKRILGVSEYRQSYMPLVLEGQLTWDDVVYGDFNVCPFTHSEPGKMQFVCIESASRLTRERYVESKRNLQRLPDAAGR
jgi:hypothetical protein